MTHDILGYLQGKGLTLKRAGGDEFSTHCFFCNEAQDKRGRLYINTNPDAEIPGLFDCKRCGAHGALPTIMKHFGDKMEAVKNDNTTEVRNVLKATAKFYAGNLGEDIGADAFEYLQGPERCLTIPTIVDRQLGYAGAAETNSLYKYLRNCGFVSSDILSAGVCRESRTTSKLVDTFKGMITIPYMMHGDVVDIRGRAWPWSKDSETKTPKYRTLGGKDARLFNTDCTWTHDELTICEGEFDAMVVEQMGFPAVGVPGANTWHDNWDSYLEDSTRLFIAFDPDDAGKKGSVKLNERFGRKIRDLPTLDGDVTDWYSKGNGPAEFQALLDEVGLGNFLVTVGQAIEEHAAVQGIDGLKLGIEELDMHIEPGLLPGQVMVVLAKSGTGKTICCLNLMQRIRMVPGQEDTDFLFISLEQTRGEWWERARRIWRFYNVDGTDEDCQRWWNDHLYIVDRNRLTPEEFQQVLDDYKHAKGKPPDVCIVDYLGYFAQSFTGDRYSRTSDAIMALKGTAKAQEPEDRFPIITPHQVSRIAKYGEEPDVDAARDAGVVEETADFLFTLWSPDTSLGRAEEEKSGIVNLRIGKSRHGGRGTKIAMQFAPISLAMVPHGDTKHAAMARREIDWERMYHDKWEDVVFRHQTGLNTGSIDRGVQGDFPDDDF